MSDNTLTVKLETVTPGEARWDTDDHEHRWVQGNNILGDPFAQCLCGATAEMDDDE